MVSAGPYSAYVAGRSDGRLYRRLTGERARRLAGTTEHSRAAALRRRHNRGTVTADERGVHLSNDGGKGWRCMARYETSPHHLRGLAFVR